MYPYFTQRNKNAGKEVIFFFSKLKSTVSLDGENPTSLLDSSPHQGVHSQNWRKTEGCFYGRFQTELRWHKASFPDTLFSGKTHTHQNPKSLHIFKFSAHVQTEWSFTFTVLFRAAG